MQTNRERKTERRIEGETDTQAEISYNAQNRKDRKRQTCKQTGQSDMDIDIQRKRPLRG